MGLGTLVTILCVFGLIFLIRDYCKQDEGDWTLEEIEELNKGIQKSIDDYTERL